MPTGTVKMFDEDKGYGFIQPDDNSDDVFVHRKVHGQDRTAYLRKGDNVTFEKEYDDRKAKYCASSCSGFKSREGGGGGDDSYGGGGRGGGGGGGGGRGGERRGVCRDFQEGRCDRGDRCKFEHAAERGRSRSRDRGGGGGGGGGGYGMPAPGGYGMPPPGYGYPPPGYGMPPPGYGMPPPGYGMPPPGYGMPPPGYGMPPPGPHSGPPPLPAGWEQVNDPASGRPYFCNRATGETSWTPPPAGPAPGPAGPPPGGPPGGGLPQGWEQASDPTSGKPYFFNRATGATQWTPP